MSFQRGRSAYYTVLPLRGDREKAVTPCSAPPQASSVGASSHDTITSTSTSTDGSSGSGSARPTALSRCCCSSLATRQASEGVARVWRCVTHVCVHASQPRGAEIRNPLRPGRVGMMRSLIDSAAAAAAAASGKHQSG